jgi:hypothetical protein
MARIRRKHKLELAEHLALDAQIQGVDHTLSDIYSLITERFGLANKKSQRLQALQRKLTEVRVLLAEQAQIDISPEEARINPIDPKKLYEDVRWK